MFKGYFKYAFFQFKPTGALYAFFIHFINSSAKKQSEKVAVFLLDDGHKDRYVFSIINTYRLAGYDIFLKPKFSFYSSCNGLYILYIFTFLKVRLLYSSKQIKNYTFKVFITDCPKSKFPSNFNKYLTIDYKLAFKNHPFTLPFPFHPLIYISQNLNSTQAVENYLLKSRSSPKKMSITFGGSIFHKSYYDINKNFKSLINRNDLLKYILTKFSDKIRTDSDLNDDITPIVIIDSNSTNKINFINWMEYLSSSNFIIAAPGFEMPFSHNVIEALACGVIPIIQYNKLFNPSLEHEKTCLMYNNLNELENCITNALNMEKEKLNEMRLNSINYYLQNLSPASFINKIEFSDKKNITISIISGEFSF